MRAFKIVTFIVALSALVLFLAWAKGWVGHLQDFEEDEVYVQAVARRMPNGWTVYTNEGGRWRRMGTVDELREAARL